MKVKVFNKLAKEVKEIEVSDVVFAREYSAPLVHQVVVAQLANLRQGTKSALTRTEVRGGGRKPWRQKGTGQARQGSTRAPQWIKGGVVFAPKPRDFSQSVNKTMRREALKSALSKKLADNEITVLESFDLTAPKTREVASVLKAFDFNRSTLIVVKDDADAVRAARNIDRVTVIEADLINVYDVVAHSKCLMTEAAIRSIEEAYNE